MAVKWKVKNGERKEYAPAQGRTDYNIPMLGYRSSIFIFIASISTIFVVPELMKLMFNDYRLPTVILSGISIGFSVAFAQYYIERKKKADKKFFLLGIVLSLFLAGAFFLIYYAGIIY